MPLFHSNAAVAGFTPCRSPAGATAVLRRRFSATDFLPDVRKYGVTFFNYVGKPLTYILATPDAARRRRHHVAHRVRQRGRAASTSTASRSASAASSSTATARPRAASTCRRPTDTPQGSLGLPVPEVPRRDPRPRDRRGVPARRVRRARPAAQRRGGDRRDREPRRRRRLRGLLQQPRGQRGSACATASTGPATSATATTPGFFYFAGRNSDWLRVDGENFAAAPVEQVIARHPDVVLAAVYAVPSTRRSATR